ncbi:hypothetical protein LZ32DRAFT_67137 [Colletotrichum eremochloae]|nr:hypothetical protein LZ32DRAFT_67137 [Colletotrichum eremochloae]
MPYLMQSPPQQSLLHCCSSLLLQLPGSSPYACLMLKIARGEIIMPARLLLDCRHVFRSRKRQRMDQVHAARETTKYVRGEKKAAWRLAALATADLFVGLSHSATPFRYRWTRGRQPTELLLAVEHLRSTYCNGQSNRKPAYAAMTLFFPSPSSIRPS